MDWARRTLAVYRAWGLGTALGVSVVLAGIAVVAGDASLNLSIVHNRITTVHVLPVLTATALGFPLVDRTPGLTVLGKRSSAFVPTVRLLAAAVVALPVASALVLIGWTVAGASVVVGFLGVSAVFVSLLRIWYWAPMLVVMVVWVALRPPYAAVGAGGEWMAISVATLLLGGTFFIGIESWRALPERQNGAYD